MRRRLRTLRGLIEAVQDRGWKAGWRLPIPGKGRLPRSLRMDGFLKAHGVRSIGMFDRIIGCPHEEGIDYPDGQACPACPFWAGRDRWSGKGG